MDVRVSEEAQSPIHFDRLSGEEGCALGRQVEYRAGDIGGASLAPERRLLDRGASRLRRRMNVMETGGDEPGRDAVDADSRRSDFARQSLREGEKPALCRAVMRGLQAAAIVRRERA